MSRSMEQKSRCPPQRRNERRWGDEEFERCGRQGKGGSFEKGCSHVCDGMCNRVKDIHFNARRKRSVGTASKKSVNKTDESRMNVARALRLCSQGKEDIFRVCVVLGVVEMFLVASNLRSLGVSTRRRRRRRR